MITETQLKKIGFVEEFSVFKGKNEFVFKILKQETTGGNIKALSIVYDIKYQYCSFIDSEFCIIGRECKTESEIEMFIDAIRFLFCTSGEFNLKTKTKYGFYDCEVCKFSCHPNVVCKTCEKDIGKGFHYR